MLNPYKKVVIMPRKVQSSKKEYISDFNDGVVDEEVVSPSIGEAIFTIAQLN